MSLCFYLLPNKQNLGKRSNGGQYMGFGKLLQHRWKYPCVKGFLTAGNIYFYRVLQTKALMQLVSSALAGRGTISKSRHVKKSS